MPPQDWFTSGLVDAHGRQLNPGGAEALVRRPGGELSPTVFPLPVRPLSELTPQMRRQAIGATYTGRLEEAADLYRQIVTENGYFSGLLATMAHGILGMPRTFQGRADMVEALDDAGGTPSEYTAMHPESEAAQCFADGIGFGIGFGKNIYPADSRRAPGVNRLGRLEWRDPRWLWRNPISLQWYETTRSGMRPINPGDGETFMFCPYPDLDVWRHGPWLYMTLAGIFQRDSEFDRQRVSEVTTPTPVMRAEKATSKEARMEALERLKDLAHDHRIVLPEQWIYEIVSASGEYNDVTTAIVEWATGMVEVGLTGNMMGMKAQSAFTDANVYKRTTTDRRRFYAATWCQTVRRDGLVYWGEDNYADRNVPVMRIDVESPEDKLAKSKADEQEGTALKSLRAGYDAVGFDLDPRYLEERAQARGHRIVPQPGGGARRLSWDAKTLAGFVTMEQAIADQGLPPLPPGDPRAPMMVSSALHPGGPSTPAGATPSPPASDPSASSTNGAPAPPAARLPEDECDPETDDDCPDDEDERRRALASQLTTHGYARCACKLGRTHRCDRCGVQRTYSAGPPGPDGSPTFPVAWRAVPRRGALTPVAVTCVP